MLFNKLVEKVAATEKLHLVGFIFWNLFWLKLRNRHFYLYHRFWGTPARSLVKCILQELAILFDRNTLFRFPLNFFNFRFWPLWAYSWKLNYKLLMSNKHVCFWKKKLSHWLVVDWPLLFYIEMGKILLIQLWQVFQYPLEHERDIKARILELHCLR
jgi:hypothetical protein